MACHELICILCFKEKWKYVTKPCNIAFDVIFLSKGISLNSLNMHIFTCHILYAFKKYITNAIILIVEFFFNVLLKKQFLLALSMFIDTFNIYIFRSKARKVLLSSIFIHKQHVFNVSKIFKAFRKNINYLMIKFFE